MVNEEKFRVSTKIRIKVEVSSCLLFTIVMGILATTIRKEKERNKRDTNRKRSQDNPVCKCCGSLYKRLYKKIPPETSLN